MLRSIKIPCTLLLLLLAVCAAHADPVDDYIRQKMVGQHIPGLSLAVVLDGKIVKARGYGYANLELQVPATAQTVYQIQSMTKQFTATAVMMLVEQGKIGLEETVGAYLPGTPETWRKIKIRHLLTHTSGLKDYINEPTQSLRLEVSEAEVLKAAALRPLNFMPGERFEYSNTNYHLLGMIIHQVSGKAYGEFLQEHIFDPLGMQDTHIISLADIVARRASGYNWDGAHLHNGDYLASSIVGYAGGGILSTALDLAKWDAALTGEKLLKASSLEQMWTSGSLNDGSATGYGFGWGIGETNGHKFIAHSGGNVTGFTTVITRFLKDRLTLVVLTNQRGKADPTGIATAVAANYLPTLLSPLPKIAEIAPALLETYTGHYEVQNNVLGTVTTRNGRLYLTTNGEKWELLPTSEDSFFLTDPALDPLRKVRLVFKDVHTATQRLVYTIDAKEIREAAPFVGPLIRSLRPQSDTDPAFTHSVEALLQAISRGDKTIAGIPFLSSGFRQDFAEVRLPELAGLHTLDFLAAQNVSGRGIERHGSVVKRILTYKASKAGSPRYILIYLTDGGLITDEDIVQE